MQNALDFKIGEVVLVDDQFEATIRDIFTRTIKDENGDHDVYLSYRLHEKDWWYEEILPHRIKKLKGE